MGLSVNDVLHLDIVQAGDPEIVAGRRGLDRTVRWVHIADVLDIAPLLKGEELLLTSGLSLDHPQARLRRYVAQLADARVAGIFMTLGWAVSAAPRAMVDEAERAGLPFVVLHRPIPFVEVTERVHSEIVNRQFVMVRKAERIGRSFTEIVLRGSGVRPIVEELGRLVDRPVVLENGVHQVVDLWEPAGAATSPIGPWDRHARTGHAGSNPRMAIAVEADLGCAWLPISMHEEEWGRLHVLLEGAELDEIDRLALHHGAVAISLALLSRRTPERIVDQVEGDLIDDIVRSRLPSDEAVYRRAQALGHDLHDARLLALAVEADGLAVYIRRHGLGDSEIRRVKGAIVEIVREAIEAAGCSAIVGAEDDDVLAVVGVPATMDLSVAVDALGARIQAVLPARIPGLEATIGVSREASLVLGLPRAFEEAREAVLHGRSIPGSGGVYRFENLGLDSLILALRNSTELNTFIESQLGPLLEHDAKRQPKLVPTLRAFLEHGGNKSATAKAIHLERRSVYHRLERIGSILGCELDDVETCTRLFVAIKALSLVRRADERLMEER